MRVIGVKCRNFFSSISISSMASIKCNDLFPFMIQATYNAVVSNTVAPPAFWFTTKRFAVQMRIINTLKSSI